MLRAMQEDTVALGRLVVAMNDPLRKQELPPVEILWQAGDLQKAIDGDPVLREKLESDMRVFLIEILLF